MMFAAQHTTNTVSLASIRAAVIALLLVGIFAFLGNPGQAVAAQVDVGSWDDLENALASSADGDVFVLTADIEMPAGKTIAVNKQITLQCADGGATIRREYQPVGTTQLDPMVLVTTGGMLTLGENLTFSGVRSGATEGDDRYWWNSDFKEGVRGFFVQVESEGGLVIDGATFEGYRTAGSTSGNRALIPAGVSPIFIAGDFIMNSGTVMGNHAGATANRLDDREFYRTNSFLTWENGSPAALNGEPNVSNSSSEWTVSQTTAGAIFIDAPGKRLEMNGGTLSNNKGNAGNLVVAGGSLTIRDGVIEKGFGDHFSGGIYTVTEDAEVRMCGGYVSQNESPMAGGVFATSNSSFFLMGGTIDNNWSYGAGGGVLVYSNNVHLLSGSITNNSSPTFGGGVYVYGHDQNIQYQYIMTLHNAQITGNEAVSSATDGRIKGSDALSNRPQALRSADTFMAGSGGGVWLCPAGVSEFDATTINLYENSALNQGADFHKDAGFEGGILLDFSPHSQLSDWIHTEQAGSWSNHTNGPKYDMPLTEAEATSGSPEALSLDNQGKTQNAQSPQLFIMNNVSLRGGGLGSNGVLILSDQSNDRDIDKGELEFQKTFRDLPVSKMEYDMVLADDNGKPVKDAEGNDVLVLTFRLFDKDYAANYESYRMTTDRPEFGQFKAEWLPSDNNVENGKIKIKFPEGKDGVTFFDSETLQAGAPLNVIIREFEVKDDDSRGAQVDERFLSYPAPEYEDVQVDLDHEVSVYRGGDCNNCTAVQGCDECGCDPGPADTFSLRYRTYNFSTNAENAEPVEIEKYVNQAVHSDIELDDVFSFDILAYVPQDADEVTITDQLGADLEFAPTDGNVKVYDLGETVDDAGNRRLIDSNHLPVYDVSGKAIDNGDVTPSVKEGTEIDKNTYNLDTTNNMLTLTIANKLEGNDETGYTNVADEQFVTPLRGHYVRVHFDVQIAKDVRAAIKAGTKAYSNLQTVTVDPTSVDESRPAPNTGNNPVVSDQEHTGIPNAASYEVKVKNEAREHYKDTSNTVTVKPNNPDIPDIPGEPDKPSGPDNPDNPDTSDVPDKPGSSKEPTKAPTQSGASKAVKGAIARTGDDATLLVGACAALTLAGIGMLACARRRMGK